MRKPDDFLARLKDVEDMLAEADLEYRLFIASLIGREEIPAARYLMANRQRILPEIVLKAEEQGVESADLTNKYCRGVAERFKEGLMP